ncbi:hypothetical protein BGW42_001654 [Actinomortierella wolfii]|nr:hypothetical protein BGW42_001654 [Actinomortierella wolfii]
MRDRSFSRSRSRSRSPARRSLSPADPGLANTIKVAKLTKNVTEAHIKEIFGMYGSIKSINFPIDKRCFAEVEYETKEEAEKAIEAFNGGQLDGEILDVAFATKRYKPPVDAPPSRQRQPPTRQRSPPRRRNDYYSPPRRRGFSPPRGMRGGINNIPLGPARGSDRAAYGRGRSRSRSRSPPPRRGGGGGMGGSRRMSRSRSPVRRRRSRSFSPYRSRSRGRSLSRSPVRGGPGGRGHHMRGGAAVVVVAPLVEDLAEEEQEVLVDGDQDGAEVGVEAEAGAARAASAEAVVVDGVSQGADRHHPVEEVAVDQAGRGAGVRMVEVLEDLLVEDAHSHDRLLHHVDAAESKASFMLYS